MLKKHNIRPFLGIFAILALLGFVVSVLFKPGIIYFTDVTDGLNETNLIERYLYTYSHDTSEPLTLAEKARLPLFTVIYAMYKAVNLLLAAGPEAYVKVKILLLFTSTLLIYVISTYKLLGALFKNTNRLTILIASITCAIYYVTNYWFTNRITHFGLFFTTALIPAAFYLLYKFFHLESGSKRDLLVLALFLFFFSGTPHSVLLFGVVFISMILSSFITDKKFSYKKATDLVLFLLIYLATSTFWLLPNMKAALVPDASINKTIVQAINKESFFPNTVELKGYWLAEHKNYEFLPNKAAQTVVDLTPLTLLIVVVALRGIPLALRISLTLISASSIFLTSTNLGSEFLYNNLLFNQYAQTFGWLFREFDKFGLLLAYTYSLVFAILAIKIINKVVRFSFYFLFLLTLLNSLNYFYKTFTHNYSPVKMPADYGTINDALQRDKDSFNVLWFPEAPTPSWSDNQDVRYVFSNLVSSKPTITKTSTLSNYVDFIFKKENLYSTDLGKELDLIGVKYVIIRSDLPNPSYSKEIEHLLRLQPNLELIVKTPFLTLYKNVFYSSLTKLQSSKIVASTGLGVLQQIYPITGDFTSGYLDYTDKDPQSKIDVPRSIPVNKETNLDYYLSENNNNFIYPADYSYDKEDGKLGKWKTGSLENTTHEELDYFFPKLDLNIHQFDFSKGIIVARPGYQLINTDSGATFELKFSNDVELKQTNNIVTYSGVSGTPSEIWDIHRSDKFVLNGSKAINISLTHNIQQSLKPHFKIVFYDVFGNVVNNTVVVENPYSNQIAQLISVPDEAIKADLSIWKISTPDVPGGYKISNLRVEDATQHVGPITQMFTAKTECSSDCVAYVRTLFSSISGELKVRVEDTQFSVLTLDKNSEKFGWVRLGDVTNLPKNVRFEISNTAGFNAVNAIYILSKTKEAEILERANAAVTDDFYATRVSTGIQTKEINPTLFELTIAENVGKPIVLTFAKPYSKNWNLSIRHETNPFVANGYINGWYLPEGIVKGKYYIQHTPQRYYVLGGIISAITVLSISIYLLTSARVLTRSELKSNSQG